MKIHSTRQRPQAYLPIPYNNAFAIFLFYTIYSGADEKLKIYGFYSDFIENASEIVGNTCNGYWVELCEHNEQIQLLINDNVCGLCN